MFTSNGGNGIGLPYMYDHHQQTCFLHLPPDSLPEMIKESSPCKKPIKKDRHSKIVTAQGARDRRMRLSLEIAKRFFHLQDLLGFDKASKTIGWLLNQARVAINELVASPGSGRIKDLGCSGKNGSTCKAGTSPASDGEIGSGIDESTMEENQNDNWMEKIPAGFKEGKIRKKVANPLARESRAKARLRARQRTSMKKSLDDTKNLRSASPLETGEEVISFQSMDHQGSYPNIGEDCFSSIYCLDCNENLGLNQKGTINFFMENGMGRTHSSGFVNPQNHVSIEAGQDNNLITFPFSPALSVPFADIPLWSKSWEGFSNQSLC